MAKGSVQWLLLAFTHGLWRKGDRAKEIGEGRSRRRAREVEAARQMLLLGLEAAGSPGGTKVLVDAQAD